MATEANVVLLIPSAIWTNAAQSLPCVTWPRQQAPLSSNHYRHSTPFRYHRWAPAR